MHARHMRIVDACCGIGRWATKDKITPSEPAEILAIMDSCGVDSALVFSNLIFYNAWAPDANRLAAETAAVAPDRFVPAFVLAPRPYKESVTPDDFAVAMKQAQAKAAWLFPAHQQHGVALWLIGDLLSMCVQKRIPLFLPADNVSPDQIHDICRGFPKLRLILANLGYRSDNWLYPLLKLHSELRVCLGPTYIPPLGPEQFVRHFGAKRMIFGSGLPQFAPGGLIAHVMYSRLKEAEKQQILAANIETLMKEVRL